MPLRRGQAWLMAAGFWTIFAVICAVQVWMSMLTHGHSLARIILYQAPRQVIAYGRRKSQRAPLHFPQRFATCRHGHAPCSPDDMRYSTLDRREFTRLSLLAMLSGVAITITGCGGGSDGPGAPTPPSTDGEEGSITANHGHRARITSAELTAGGQLTVSLGPAVGVPDHTHTVSLTAAEVVSIRDGARVSKSSTTEDAHNHTVTFN
jgi:hypothetical protein